VKRISSYLPVLFGLALCVPFVNAQTSFDINLGFGSYTDTASGAGLDNATSLNAFGACTPGSSDTACQSTPSLGGFFLGIGGDLMLYKHLGVGFQANLQPTRDSYGPLQYRQTFYDVNAIYAPINRKRVVLDLEGGVGGAKTSFSYSQSSCIGTAVCTTQAESVGNTNHFLIHAGVGVQFFLTEHVFIRPQFDYYYIPNFTDQFGRDSVAGGSVWLGYNFGSRE
jgi:opacity protein-like surface antigen